MKDPMKVVEGNTSRKGHKSWRAAHEAFVS